MKKLAGFVFIGLLSTAIYAHDWTVGGNINLITYNVEIDEWWGSNSISHTDFSLSLNFGRYVTENINIGLRTGFQIGDEIGNNFTIGPYIKFDFLEFDRIYFSLTGMISYTRFDDTIVTRNNINVAISPSVTFRINRNVCIYWRFATVIYQHGWSEGITMRAFGIRGPLTNPTFGMIFRFGSNDGRGRYTSDRGGDADVWW